jgi:EAL domain-containing protein (putative c-di-GMP-specific phosphodiesterase class I)
MTFHPTYARSTSSAAAASDGAMPIDEIWQALVNDQLVPYFQPLVEISTRRVVGAEALARWRHPALGVLSPVTFVPVLEERGMIRELTELILEKSLYACRDWLDRGRDIRVSINLALQSLLDDSLPATLEHKVRLSGLQPSQLVLEFAESTLRKHWEETAPRLAIVREMGFGVAIDEFGIGAGIIQELTRKHFTEIKIDRAFIHGAGSNKHLRAILEENLQLGRDQNLYTVAIGVEDAADLMLLAELGCGAVQGYICSAPLPADGLLQWAEQWENIAL